MTQFSEELIARLRESALTLSSTRPRLLLGADEVQAVRERARSTQGVIDVFAERANAAAERHTDNQRHFEPASRAIMKT